MPKATAREYIYANRLAILAGMGSLVLVDISQLFIPRVTKHAIDDLAYLALDAAQLLRYGLIILGLAGTIAVFRYIWRRCLIGTSRKIERDIRNRLFAHIQTLDTAYFNKTSTGDLMARATNDINNIRMATGFGLVALTDAIFLGISAIAFMAYINVELTLYSLIPMPFIVVFTRLFSKKMHKMFQQVQAAFADMTEVVRERFAGIRIIKAFGRQDIEAERFDEISRDYIRQNLKLVRVTGTFFPMMVFFTNVSTALVLGFGGRQTILTTITPGDFVAFISYLGLLTWPMMALGWVTNLIQRGRASLDRINQVLATTPAITDPVPARSLPGIEQGLSVEDVSFTYGPDLPPCLQHISFTLPRRQALCIIGPPGSGKTTLADLMIRVYAPQAGKIRVDGIDIKDLNLVDLRRYIGVMPQEPFLFSATIKENITFDSTVPDDDPALIEACRRAGLYDTVRDLFTRGFSTITGEKGVILSGGQKQRVALARIFYHDPPILILDDPVSQVDTATAGDILDSLKTTTADKTVIFISHRLTLARSANQVIVLQDGVLTESGTHDELLQKGGYYARVWQLQQLEEEHG